MSPSTPGRPMPSRVIPALCVIGGLLLGLLLAVMIAKSSKPTYSAATNYAVLPGTRSTSSDLGQVAFLTPVFAGRANDPTITAQVTKALGGAKPQPVVTTTYPDSQLIFTLTATGEDPQAVLSTLQAYEKVLISNAQAGDPVSPTNARLSLSTHAALPTDPVSTSAKVVYLGGAVAGSLIGLALALGLARRRSARADEEPAGTVTATPVLREDDRPAAPVDAADRSSSAVPTVQPARTPNALNKPVDRSTEGPAARKA